MIADTVGRLREAAADPASRLAEIAERGLWTYTALDADYPARLRDLVNPPAVIHGLGDRAALHRERAVGVVGTRRPTPAGRALATRICARLVECGATVVSGLAVGIDGAAHAATLERGGTHGRRDRRWASLPGAARPPAVARRGRRGRRRGHQRAPSRRACDARHLPAPQPDHRRAVRRADRRRGAAQQRRVEHCPPCAGARPPGARRARPNWRLVDGRGAGLVARHPGAAVGWPRRDDRRPWLPGRATRRSGGSCGRRSADGQRPASGELA